MEHHKRVVGVRVARNVAAETAASVGAEAAAGTAQRGSHPAIRAQCLAVILHESMSGSYSVRSKQMRCMAPGTGGMVKGGIDGSQNLLLPSSAARNWVQWHGVPSRARYGAGARGGGRRGRATAPSLRPARSRRQTSSSRWCPLHNVFIVGARESRGVAGPAGRRAGGGG